MARNRQPVPACFPACSARLATAAEVNGRIARLVAGAGILAPQAILLASYTTGPRAELSGLLVVWSFASTAVLMLVWGAIYGIAADRRDSELASKACAVGTWISLLIGGGALQLGQPFLVAFGIYLASSITIVTLFVARRQHHSSIPSPNK